MHWPWNREADLNKKKQAVVERNAANFTYSRNAVLVTMSASVLASLLCRRSVRARRFVPNRFEANIYPPKFSPVKDAARAVLDATLLATSFFSFGVASAFWVFGVASLPELGRVLTAKYTPKRSNYVDEESKSVEKSLVDWFSRK